MHLETHFEGLYDRIKLDPVREKRISDALQRLNRSVADDALNQYIVSAPVPQGSWAQGTVVKPPSDEPNFDVDILLPMDFNRFPEDKRTPGEILDYVRRRLKPMYGAAVRTRDKCVRIQYSEHDGFHVDVVPAHVVDKPSGPFQICSKTSGFLKSNPLAMTAWVKEMDQETRGHFSRAIVCLKRWRDLKLGNSAPKSILLTCLAGQALAKYYGRQELLTTQFTTLEAHVRDIVVCIRALLGAGPTNILIPGSTDDLYGPWPQAHHDAFVRKLDSFDRRADLALAQRSVQHAITHWRTQFGQAFPGNYD